MLLPDFKDKHKNQRCFILGTGPSINYQKISYLKNDIVIGVNSIYHHPIICSYMVVSDQAVWNAHSDNILRRAERDRTTVFTCMPSVMVHQNVVDCLIRKKDLADSDPADWEEIEKGVFRSGSVVVAALHLAYYMGFNEVFLLGCDCHYEAKKHFDGSPVAGIEKTNWNRVFKQYEAVKTLYGDRKIINATLGGNLEVFPRKTIQDIFNVQPPTLL